MGIAGGWWAGRSRRSLLAICIAALLCASGVVALGTASAAPSARAATSTGVLSVVASPYTTEQSGFTVGMEVSDPSAVQFAYFSFCQLSNPVCYIPAIQLKQNGTDWFSGTTKLMSEYPGMLVGVRAGFNITIDYASGNVTEPTIPNNFPGVQIGQEVNGAYMFVMSVGPNLYALSGVVKDSVSGVGIAGATVSVSPSDNSTVTAADGSYTLGGLPNGTYTLSISHGGYTTATQGVAINGGNAVQNVPLYNATGPGPTKSSSSGSNLLSNSTVWVAVVVAAVVVIALLAVGLLRRRGGGTSPTPRSQRETASGNGPGPNPPN